MANKEIITGYKAFNDDLTCRDFQYQIGKTYNYDGDIEICEKGFHFCHEYPFDVLNFYPIIDENGNMRRFARVSCPASKAISGDKKTVTSSITIVEELMLHNLVYEQIRQILTITGDDVKVVASRYGAQVATSDYDAQVVVSGDDAKAAASGDDVKVVASGGCTRVAASGDDAQVVASGDRTQAAASGDAAKVAASGYAAKVAASGYDAQIVASGDRAQVAVSGKNAQVAVSGDRAQVASSGGYSQMVASGYGAQVAVSGDRAKVVATGKNSVIAISGLRGCFKGVNSTFVSCADFGDDGKCIGFVTGCIGEDGLKENTWYTVNNGKFVEYDGPL